MKFNFFIILLFIFISCSVEGVSQNSVKKENKNNIDDSKCVQLISAAEFQDQSEQYQDCVDTYSRSLKSGCAQKHGDKIFKWMANAYVELDKLDSAKLVINQGLKALPDDTGVIGIAANIARKTNDSDNHFFYLNKKYNLEDNIQELINITSSDDSSDDIMKLELKLGIESPKGSWGEGIDKAIESFQLSRGQTFKALSDYCKNKGRETGEDFYYSDQIEYLEEWLSYNPNDSDDIIKVLRVAYKNAGRDAIEIDQRRWEQDESNVNTALIYINELMDSSEFDTVVEVCLTVLDNNSNNIKILERLALAYLELYSENEAINIYNRLIKLKPLEIKYQTKISEIYRETGEYGEALKFANKIIKKKPSAEAFFNRATIYSALVEYCGEDELTMSDKAVYEMAWNDLNKAASKGHKKSKKQSKYYEKNNLITQLEDWFKLSGKPNTFKPKGKCYSIIKGNLKKRKF